MSNELHALLEAHESVIVEREQAKQNQEENKFREGHINGLNEARNRIEEVIMERSGVNTKPLRDQIKEELDKQARRRRRNQGRRSARQR